MRVGLRILGGALLTLLAIAFMLLALLLVIEFRLPLDGQRDAIAAALAQALDAEVRISGPLWLISGARPGVEAGGLHLARGLKDNRLSADLELVRVRLPWSALLSREIRLSEATVAGAKLCVSTASDAPPAERTPSARSGSAWRLTGIDTLRIEVAALRAGPDCTALPGPIELRSLTLSAAEGEALSVAASGAIAGEAWQLDLRGPRLQSLVDTSAPVPFKLAAGSAEGKLSVDGRLLLSPLSVAADVVFESPQFVAHIRPLGAPFKDFGPLSVRAQVRADAHLLSVRLDEARLVPGVASGEFSFDWSGALPRLTARARTGKLDAAALQRWLADAIDVDRLRPGHLQRLMVAGARASDGSLAIEAGHVEVGRAAFDAAVIAGTWHAGKGRGSIGARLGTVAIKGAFEADVRSDDLSFAATAATRAVALQQVKGIAATADGIDAKLTARARLGQDLGEGLRAAVDVRNARLALPRDGGERLAITLDSMHADWQARSALRVAAAGAALGERFDARIEGADALRLFRGEPWQLSASAAFGPLRLQTHGSLALRAGKPLAQLDVTAAADALGSLVPAAVAKLPLDVRGRIELAEAAWRVDLASLRLGKTQGRVNASGSLPLAARPLGAEAVFEVLDLASFAGQGGDMWERLWLPRRLAFPDADITLRAARVLAPGGAVAKVELSAKTRGGRLEQVPFALETDGASIAGNFSADLRQDIAQVSAAIAARGLDKFVAGEQGADGAIHVKAGNVKATAAATGNRLRELAGSLELQIDARDAHAAIGRRGKVPLFEAALAETRLSLAAGRATSLKVSGTFADQPLSVEASSGPLAAWLPPGSAPFAFLLSGRVAGLDVGAKGEIPLAGAGGEAALEVRVSAERLDALNALLSADLPAVGPFVLEATRRKSAEGEMAADVRIALGESRMAGRVAGRRIGNRPALDIDLTSTLLRLEDLGTKALAEPSEGDKQGKRQPSRMPSAKDVQHAQGLLDELDKGLRKFDARAHLALRRITAAGEDVGRVEAMAKLESGRLRLAPFRYDGSLGGALDVDLDADFATGDASYRLAATFDRLHYGALMKSVEPGHTGAGELSLKLKLAGRGALAAIATTLEGEADLIVFPSALPSAWLDKLGGGLLRNLGTDMDAEASSKMNCAVATFDIAGGRAKSAALMLDSTRVRAAGELEVDLAIGALQGQLASKSKRPELFSASLPLGIGGTLAHPKVAPLTGSLAVSAARYYYFAYAYLFDTVTTKRLAEDGRPDCIAAYAHLAK